MLATVCLPRLLSPTFRPLPAMKPPATRSEVVLSSDGTPIYADAAGDPAQPHLVLVHGFTLSAAVFDNIVEDDRYTRAFYLVRYDMRGHGRSGKPDRLAAYASELFAADFAAVCNAFALHRPVVLGWSLGATVIADIALHLPLNSISGAIYVAGCPYVGPVITRVGTPFIIDIIQRYAENLPDEDKQAALESFLASEQDEWANANANASSSSSSSERAADAPLGNEPRSHNCSAIARSESQIGTDSTTTTTALDQTHALHTLFADACFADNGAHIPWRTRALWRGMAAFQRPAHQALVLSRPQRGARKALVRLGGGVGWGTAASTCACASSPTPTPNSCTCTPTPSPMPMSMPALSLLGTADPQLNAHGLHTELSRAFARLDFVMLQGVGHSPLLEAPAETMERVGRFVRACWRSGDGGEI